jgi:hypothetical protein
VPFLHAIPEYSCHHLINEFPCPPLIADKPLKTFVKYEAIPNEGYSLLPEKLSFISERHFLNGQVFRVAVPRRYCPRLSAVSAMNDKMNT